jgi:hypothetical protein
MPLDKFISVTGKGGETLKFGPITVQPVLGLHAKSMPNWDRVNCAMNAAYKMMQDSIGAARSPANEAAFWKIATPTADPRVIKEGLIVYAIDFDGFRLVINGGGSDPSQYERDFAAKAGPVDMLIMAYTYPIPQVGIDAQWPSIALWKPKYLMPTHHDDTGGLRYEAAIEPLFETVREKLPGTSPYSACSVVTGRVCLAPELANFAGVAAIDCIRGWLSNHHIFISLKSENRKCTPRKSL